MREKFPGLIDGNHNETIEDFEAHLILKPNYTPIFHKAYAVPYALVAKVEENIENLVKDGILIPTRSLAWASPMVMVKKSDGSVRICIDGKATINQYFSVEHYPLPKYMYIGYDCKLENIF